MMLALSDLLALDSSLGWDDWKSGMARPTPAAVLELHCAIHGFFRNVRPGASIVQPGFVDR